MTRETGQNSYLTTLFVGRGRVDLTIGSALDIFGGSGVRYEDVVAFNQRAHSPTR